MLFSFANKLMMRHLAPQHYLLMQGFPNRLMM